MTFLRKSGARDSGRAHDPTRPSPDALMELAEFRPALDSWLDQHEAVLTEDHEATATLDAQMAHLAKVKRMAYDAGFMRWGWPERVGGLGGSTLLRAYLGEALTVP